LFSLLENHSVSFTSKFLSLGNREQEGDSSMDHGRQSDFLFAKLGASRFRMRELLTDAIADLPERERLVFTLYYYEELETTEIALVLGDTLFAVRQLHVSAKRLSGARNTAKPLSG
jgi:RNA polymerase sigma factor for flagellar operon FliA